MQLKTSTKQYIQKCGSIVGLRQISDRNRGFLCLYHRSCKVRKGTFWRRHFGAVDWAPASSALGNFGTSSRFGAIAISNAIWIRQFTSSNNQQ
uniref:Uncharacterized protein n=1 Tax=Romanomermis culicivorax TaxID=13658 RepID=A0A915KLI1_ROMCU